MKIHYLITQIADIVMQLYIAFSKILNALKSPTNDVARRIGESFWGLPMEKSDLEYILQKTTMRIAAGKT